MVAVKKPRSVEVNKVEPNEHDPEDLQAEPSHVVWNSFIGITDWRRKQWRFNYNKKVTPQGWAIDWEVVAPDGKIKAHGEDDIALANRCINEAGMVDSLLLQYEFSWWINHYTNTINLKTLKAAQDA
jgi:hypothetical protein